MTPSYIYMNIYDACPIYMTRYKTTTMRAATDLGVPTPCTRCRLALCAWPSSIVLYRRNSVCRGERGLLS